MSRVSLNPTDRLLHALVRIVALTAPIQVLGAISAGVVSQPPGDVLLLLLGLADLAVLAAAAHRLRRRRRSR